MFASSDLEESMAILASSDDCMECILSALICSCNVCSHALSEVMKFVGDGRHFMGVRKWET